MEWRMSLVLDGTLGVNLVQSGTIVTADIVDTNVTPAKLSQPFTSGTALSSGSGTALDFTGIPSWVKRITIGFYALSTNGTSPLIIQLGTVSGIETTGYASGGANSVSGSTVGSTATTGLLIGGSFAATHQRDGTMTLMHLGSNLWTCSTCGTTEAAELFVAGGKKTTAAVLDRIRLTTVNGTDLFDGGAVNIFYE